MRAGKQKTHPLLPHPTTAPSKTTSRPAWRLGLRRPRRRGGRVRRPRPTPGHLPAPPRPLAAPPPSRALGTWAPPWPNWRRPSGRRGRRWLGCGPRVGLGKASREKGVEFSHPPHWPPFVEMKKETAYTTTKDRLQKWAGGWERGKAPKTKARDRFSPPLRFPGECRKGRWRSKETKNTRRT